jgi:hypothetical protein
MFPARAALAASFIVTLPMGCKRQPEGPGASVYKSDRGCMYSVETHCPEGASCNPPPPAEIDCPPELEPAAKPAGPTRAGWVRVKERFSCYQAGCHFQSDYFCPHPGKTEGRCEAAKHKDVAGEPFDAAKAQPPGGVPEATWVDAFIAERADGSCSMYTGFWCASACELPEPMLVSCTSPPPLPPRPRSEGPPAAAP